LALACLCPILPASLSFFLYLSLPPRILPSFPTRRSSDLTLNLPTPRPLFDLLNFIIKSWFVCNKRFCASSKLIWLYCESKNLLRSEEHTSELQSRFDLVCRLLLEKKNKTE